MRWGVTTQEDLDILNTRYFRNIDVNELKARHSLPIEDYFAPMAISSNDVRNNYNIEMSYREARRLNVCLYEALAHSDNPETKGLMFRLQDLSEQKTEKVPFKLLFHIHSFPSMTTKRIENLDIIKTISNGCLGFIIGFIHNDNNVPILYTNQRALDRDSNDNYSSIRTVNGVLVKTFKKLPSAIVFKVRNCERVLVEGYPPGIVLIPLTSNTLKKCKLPGATKSKYITMEQFRIICAYGLTPEKMQGLTLKHDLYVSRLEARNEMMLYVVFSRVLALKWLILSEEMKMDYVRKFLPKRHLLEVMAILLKSISVPNYITDVEQEKLTTWVKEQLSLCEESLRLNDILRPLKKGKNVAMVSTLTNISSSSFSALHPTISFFHEDNDNVDPTLTNNISSSTSSALNPTISFIRDGPFSSSSKKRLLPQYLDDSLILEDNNILDSNVASSYSGTPFLSPIGSNINSKDLRLVQEVRELIIRKCLNFH
jgi:hypothetical protein